MGLDDWVLEVVVEVDDFRSWLIKLLIARGGNIYKIICQLLSFFFHFLHCECFRFPRFWRKDRQWSQLYMMAMFF